MPQQTNTEVLTNMLSKIAEMLNESDFNQAIKWYKRLLDRAVDDYFQSEELTELLTLSSRIFQYLLIDAYDEKHESLAKQLADKAIAISQRHMFTDSQIEILLTIGLIFAKRLKQVVKQLYDQKSDDIVSVHLEKLRSRCDEELNQALMFAMHANSTLKNNQTTSQELHSVAECLIDSLYQQTIALRCSEWVKQMLPIWKQDLDAVDSLGMLSKQLNRWLVPLEQLFINVSHRLPASTTLSESGSESKVFQQLLTEIPSISMDYRADVVDALSKLNMRNRVLEILKEKLPTTEAVDNLLWEQLKRLWTLYQQIGQYRELDLNYEALEPIWQKASVCQTKPAKNTLLVLMDLATNARRHNSTVEAFVSTPSIWQGVESQFITHRQAILKSQNISASVWNETKTFLSFLDKRIRTYLGEAPCRYCLLAMGSMARQEATPFSDLEYVIAIEQNDHKESYYFQSYAILLRLLVINLGETAHYGKRRGFSIDYSGDPSILSYLIGTPEALLNRLRDFPLSDGQAHSLVTAQPLLGDKSLGESYQKIMRDFVNAQGKAFALTMATLQKNESCSGHLDMLEEQFSVPAENPSSIDLKTEFLAPLHYVISDLLYCQGLPEEADAWPATVKEQLFCLSMFTPSEKEKIIHAFTMSQALRIELHNENESKQDHYQESRENFTQLVTNVREISKLLYKKLLETISLLWQKPAISWPEYIDPIDDVIAFTYTPSEEDLQRLKQVMRQQLVRLSQEPNDVQAALNFFAAYARYPIAKKPDLKAAVLWIADTLSLDLPCLHQLPTDNAINIFKESNQPLVDLWWWSFTNELLSPKLSLLIFEKNSIHPLVVGIKAYIDGEKKVKPLIDRLLEEASIPGIDATIIGILYSLLSSSTQHDEKRYAFIKHLQESQPNLVEALSYIPNPLGDRYIELSSYEALHQQLSQMTSNQKTGEKLCWMHQEQRYERYLPNEVFKRMWDEKKQQLKSSYTNSRHEVWHSILPGVDLHFKFLPDQPLMDYAIDTLHKQLIGHGTPANTLVRLEVTNNSNKVSAYPLLVAQTAGNQTLSQVLEKNSEYSLDLRYYTELVLVALLTGSGDAASRNYVLSKVDGHDTLVSIDNEQQFVIPLAKCFLSTEIRWRNILFCLAQANVPLNIEAIKRFCALGPLKPLIIHWFYKISKQDNAYLQLFSDPGERKTLYAKQKGDKKFTPKLLVRPGVWGELLINLNYLQVHLRFLLEQNQTPTALELLQKLHPRVGRYYQQGFTSSTLPTKRFQSATQAPLQSMTSSAALEASLGIIPKFDAVEKDQAYSLESALNELQSIVESAPDFSRIITAHDQPDVPRQEQLLKGLATQQHKKLNLSYCAALTDELLQQVLSQSEGHLNTLDLRHCSKLTDNSILYLSKNHSSLEALYLNDCIGIKHFCDSGFLNDGYVYFEHLKNLDLSHCSQLKTVKVATLEELELKTNDCDSLNQIDKVTGTPAFNRWEEAQEAFKQGNTEYNLDKYDVAKNYFDKAIKLFPKYMIAYINRGNAKSNLCQYWSAITDYNVAIKLGFTDPTVYLNRGLAKFALGRYEKAISDYNEAIKLNLNKATDQSIRDFLGSIQLGCGVAEDPWDNSPTKTKLDPEHAILYYKQGNAKSELGRYKEAIEDYDKAEKLDPMNAIICNNRGTAKILFQFTSEGTQDLQKALELINKSTNHNEDIIYQRNLSHFQIHFIEWMTNVRDTYPKNILLDLSSEAIISNSLKADFLNVLLFLQTTLIEQNRLSKTQIDEIKNSFCPIIDPQLTNNSTWLRVYYWRARFALSVGDRGKAEAILENHLVNTEFSQMRMAELRGKIAMLKSVPSMTSDRPSATEIVSTGIFSRADQTARNDEPELSSSDLKRNIDM